MNKSTKVTIEIRKGLIDNHNETAVRIREQQTPSVKKPQ